MKRVYLIVSLLLAISANVAMADQATVDALQEAGVELTKAQTAAIASAQGAELANEIAGLVPSCDGSGIASETRATIISAAVSASPELAELIEASVMNASPSQAAGINNMGCEDPNAGRNIGTLDVRSNNVSVSPNK